MYARVARWEGGEGEQMRRAAEEINSRAASGPPEGVPAVGFTLLIDPDAGTGMAISLYESEDDRRKGDETLSQMDPPGDGMGRRVSIDNYEVAVDVRN
jgi:hypothetical protein